MYSTIKFTRAVVRRAKPMGKPLSAFVLISMLGLLGAVLQILSKVPATPLPTAYRLARNVYSDEDYDSAYRLARNGSSDEDYDSARNVSYKDEDYDFVSEGWVYAHEGQVLVPKAKADLKNRKVTLRIITWTDVSWSKRPWFHQGKKGFKNCKLPAGASCEYYHRRSLHRTSDAIIFKGDMINKNDMPPVRPNDQTWVFFERETIQHRPGKNWHDVGTSFNLTVSYSTQADIVHPYGRCVNTKTSLGGVLPAKNYARGKTELAAWFVSHCKAVSARDDYVAELQKHIPVHIYGACGNYKCGRHQKCQYSLLKEKYKFYLAFENSHCGDYITEKVWKCFSSGTVPVVFGSADYKQSLPPHSYIDVRDFKSPKHLAEYLQKLHKNDDLYNEYFAWKKTQKCGINNNHQHVACQVCQKLHERRLSGNPFVPFNVSKIYSGPASCQSVESFRDKCNCWPKP